jgi:hypothetical protein
MTSKHDITPVPLTVMSNTFLKKKIMPMQNEMVDGVLY